LDIPFLGKERLNIQQQGISNDEGKATKPVGPSAGNRRLGYSPFAVCHWILEIPCLAKTEANPALQA